VDDQAQVTIIEETKEPPSFWAISIYFYFSTARVPISLMPLPLSISHFSISKCGLTPGYAFNTADVIDYPLTDINFATKYNRIALLYKLFFSEGKFQVFFFPPVSFVLSFFVFSFSIATNFYLIFVVVIFCA
jgi:hypothetical protein